VGSNSTKGMDVWCVCVCVCMRLFCVCVVLCLDRGLARGRSPVQGVLQSVNKVIKYSNIEDMSLLSELLSMNSVKICLWLSKNTNLRQGISAVWTVINNIHTQLLTFWTQSVALLLFISFFNFENNVRFE
jgi:hypothetical protein